ncbi:MAG: copper resistance protein B [Luteimonas sp.]
MRCARERHPANRDRRLPRASLRGAIVATWALPALAIAQMAMPATQVQHAAHAAAPTPQTVEAAENTVKQSAQGTLSNDADAPTMDHHAMEGMDHAEMPGMDHGTAAEDSDGMAAMPMDMARMMDAMQGGDAPADARDPDYSDGIHAHRMSDADMATMDMHDDGVLGSVLIDQLETFDGDHDSGLAIDAQAWIGTDLDKLWLKLDGERSHGHLGATRAEALWNRAVSIYWNVQAGVRHDFGDGPGRNWAAIGVQGLAPYWFDVEATAYIGESGRSALRLDAEYELRLTQRLILQPDVEITLYGKDDPARGIGAGLSDIEAGLRLRYEVTRKFAPYIGVAWSRAFGATADAARDTVGDADDTQLVAGMRLWF